MKRSSHKEITKKIQKAKEAITNDHLLFINQSSLVSDALELGYLFSSEIKQSPHKLTDQCKP